MLNESASYIIRKDLNSQPLWKSGVPQLPRIDIELTERCNNNCIHCYINQAENDQEVLAREMSTSQIKEILDEAAALGCMAARLTGGEPLLRSDFKDIYLYARRLGIKVTLLTNATLITVDLVALFKRYPPGEPVEITLYGMTREDYESTSRTKGSFVAATNGINLLVENSIPIVLKTIRLPRRDDDLLEFQAFAKKYTGQSGGFAMNFNLRGRRDSPEKNLLIKKLRATPKETLAILTRNKEAYIKEKKQFASKFMRPGGPVLFTCGCGKGGAVDAYGYFQPCLLMRHPDMAYNLEQGTISDALNRFFPEKVLQQAENTQYLERCAQCFLKGLCNQCPAWSWMENGTLDTPVEYLCRVAHEQARYIGLIKEGENAWHIINWQERIKELTEKDEN
jgi:radical SAM protein with 4Fe4S-binding SPASM domain